MANQYSNNEYTINEINKIVSLYENGMSFSKIGLTLKRKKSRIKETLINEGVFVEKRDVLKKTFNESEINKIIDLYFIKKMSVRKIGIIFNVSVTPIKRILVERNLLRKGKSDGKKIELTNNKKNTIKFLYLKKYKNTKEIGKTLGVSKSFVDGYLKDNDLLRNKSEGVSVGLVTRFSGISYDKYLEKLPKYIKYRQEVIRLTNKQPLRLLKNNEKRGVSGINNAYHLDHKYSISEGFKNNVKPEIIANLKNLVFIPWRENVSKRTKCSITIEELIKN